MWRIFMTAFCLCSLVHTFVLDVHLVGVVHGEDPLVGGAVAHVEVLQKQIGFFLKERSFSNTYFLLRTSLSGKTNRAGAGADPGSPEEEGSIVRKTSKTANRWEDNIGKISAGNRRGINNDNGGQRPSITISDGKWVFFVFGKKTLGAGGIETSRFYYF